MAVTVEGSGTQTAVISTEHTLITETEAKTLVLIVDTVNMVAGDELELRVKMKVLTGGTAALAYYAVFANAQADPIKLSIPITAPFGCVATLKQTAGTGRNFDWSLVSV